MNVKMEYTGDDVFTLMRGGLSALEAECVMNYIRNKLDNNLESVTENKELCHAEKLIRKYGKPINITYSFKVE